MNLFVFLIGMAFGFLIVASGLSSYTVIHDMLLPGNPMSPSHGVLFRRCDALAVDTPAAQMENAHGR